MQRQRVIHDKAIRLKLYICINGPDLPSEDVVRRFQEGHPLIEIEVELLEVPRTPAAARNVFLRRINSSWVFFIDDDIQLPPRILLNFLNLRMKYPEIDLWGGPNLTPIASHSKKICYGWLLSHPLVVGPVFRRYGFSGTTFSQGGQFNLMLCNLFVRRTLIETEGFGVVFKTAEENELIYRLQKMDCQLGFSDELFVWHERRAGIRSFLTQIFYYGFGRGQLFCRVSLWPQGFFVLCAVLLPFAILCLLRFPSVFLLWVLVLELNYVLRFRRFEFSVLILPPMIWGISFAGIISGVVSMKTRPRGIHQASTR